jgi:hypothetical protein
VPHSSGYRSAVWVVGAPRQVMLLFYESRIREQKEEKFGWRSERNCWLHNGRTPHFRLLILYVYTDINETNQMRSAGQADGSCRSRRGRGGYGDRMEVFKSGIPNAVL